jgi:hypothetical protein
MKIEAVGSSNLLYLILFNFSHLPVTCVNSAIIKLDIFSLFWLLTFIQITIQNYDYCYRKFASGDYTGYYTTFSRIATGLVCDIAPAVAAVAKLIVTLQDSMEQAIPPWPHCRVKIPTLIYGSLRKSITFTGVLKKYFLPSL